MKYMANPAELLHEQLHRWATNAPQARARNLETGEEGWVEQRRAVKNLEHLEVVIQELKAQGKKVDVEEAYFPNWTRAVFAYPHGWRENQTYIQPTTLQFLQQTAHRLADIILPITEDAPADMLRAADEVEANVGSRDDLPVPLRLLVMESVTFLRKAVAEYEITGEFVLNKAVKKFAQALELLEETAPSDSTFQNVKTRIKRWYKSPPLQMALNGIISAQMALAAPYMNETVANSFSSAAEVFELPAGTEVESQAEATPGSTINETEEDAEE